MFIRLTYPKKWIEAAREKLEEDSDEDDEFETQVLNIGPTHPATHGTLRTVVRLDGEGEFPSVLVS